MNIAHSLSSLHTPIESSMSRPSDRLYVNNIEGYFADRLQIYPILIYAHVYSTHLEFVHSESFVGHLTEPLFQNLHGPRYVDVGQLQLRLSERRLPQRQQRY